MDRLRWSLTILILVGGALAAGLVFRRADAPGSPVAGTPTGTPAVVDPARSDRVSVGAAPATSGAAPAAATAAARAPAAEPTPQQRSVIEALAAGTHPERTAIGFAPAPFDHAAYQRDPAAYCAVSEPGRVYQTAEATGPESVHLRIETAMSPAVAAGGRLVIEARALPNAPVTFHTEGAHFVESGLGTVSVPADAAGVARATFVATGAAGITPVLVGCPLTVGTRTLHVDIRKPSAARQAVDGARTTVPAAVSPAPAAAQ